MNTDTEVLKAIGRQLEQANTHLMHLRWYMGVLTLVVVLGVVGLALASSSSTP